MAYSIDRERIIKELFNGQAKLAHSILPEDSWAYSVGTKYTYDPAKAKKLLQEAGYKGEAVTFKFVAGNAAVKQYSETILSSLREPGLNVTLETLELQTLLESLKNGQFQMNTAIWIGGNQDPIFYRDLFASTEFPDRKENGIHTDHAMGISALAAVTSVPAWLAFAVVTRTSICLRLRATRILRRQLPAQQTTRCLPPSGGVFDGL